MEHDQVKEYIREIQQMFQTIQQLQAMVEFESPHEGELPLFLMPTHEDPENVFYIGRGDQKVFIRREQIPKLLNTLFNILEDNTGGEV